MNVAVIIPHYGPQDLLDKCLRSVRIQKPKPVEVVVDSNPPSKRRLFTSAVNEGIRRANQTTWWGGPDRIDVYWILNNDCFAQPGCVAAAVELFEREPAAGIVGSQNREANNPDVICWGGSLEAFPVGKHKAGRASEGHHQKDSLELWATFASVFIRAEVVQQIGLLDENLWHLYSDSDYCLRARFAEWDVWHCAKSVVHHIQGVASKASAAPWLTKVMQADRAFFERKWMRGPTPGMNVAFPVRPRPAKLEELINGTQA